MRMKFMFLSRKRARYTLAVMSAVGLVVFIGLAWGYFRGQIRKDHPGIRSEGIGSEGIGSEGIRSEGIRSAGHSRFYLKPLDGQLTNDLRIQRADASEGDWISEQETAALMEKLDRFKACVLDRSRTVADSTLLAPDFQGQLLTSTRLHLVYHDKTMRISHLNSTDKDADFTNSIEQQFDSWTDPNAKISQCSFKVIRIRAVDGQLRARLLLQLVSKSAGTIQQDNLICDSEWESIEAERRLRRLAVVKLERIEFVASGRGLLDDATAAVLPLGKAGRDHVLRGIDHWSQRLTGIDDMHMYGHHGLAVGDVNNDLLDDVYVCDAGGLPNQLYLRGEGGIAKADAQRAGVDWLEASTCALLIDLDNDGDQDLVVATVAALIFAANDGQGRFQVRAAKTGFPEAHSLCAADYDNDGDLDLYVCNYGAAGGRSGQRGFEATIPVPYHDAQNGGRNILWQNRGRFQFRDVTRQVGLEQNNRRWTFAAAWQDYDDDGDMDLYVANDFGRNSLYQNQMGKFRDVAAASGVEDMAAGMSVAWGEYNGDGRSDLYVGNMFSAAGSRVTYQRRFVDSHSTADTGGVQRMARGNTLFAGDSEGRFVDVSLAAGVNMGRWSWSSKFADLNNDGWEDLIVANGYFTNQRTNDL